jgi:hypothetical protein
MNLRAPNVALFVIAGCLAMVGVLSALPIELPIPGMNQVNVPGIFSWAGSCCLQAACCRNARRTDNSPSTSRAARPKLLGCSESCTPSVFLR